MEVRGKVIQILPLVAGTSKKGDWKRQDVVIEYVDGQYPVKLALSNLKKAEEFSRLTLGAEYVFRFTPSSREYQGSWYTSCTCYGWDAVAEAVPAAPSAPFAAPQVTPQPTFAVPQATFAVPPTPPTANNDGGLPF